MIIVNENGMGLNAREIRFLSKLDENILSLLKNKEMYPIEISKVLKINQQTIYYHIKKLEKMKMIKQTRKAFVGGIKATYFSLSSDAFFFKIGDFKRITKIPMKLPKILNGIVDNGKLLSKIVVGSPISHGDFGTFSRDIESVSDLSLFVGSFLEIPTIATVRDTMVEDIKQSFIIVGGPRVNGVMKRMNRRLPIFFDKKWRIISALSGKTYSGDNIGMIMNVENPFNKRNRILIVSGKDHRGTKSSIIALAKYFDEIGKKNKFSKKYVAHVVRGMDKNYDDVIDDIEILE